MEEGEGRVGPPSEVEEQKRPTSRDSTYHDTPTAATSASSGASEDGELLPPPAKRSRVLVGAHTASPRNRFKDAPYPYPPTEEPVASRSPIFPSRGSTSAHSLAFAKLRGSLTSVFDDISRLQTSIEAERRMKEHRKGGEGNRSIQRPVTPQTCGQEWLIEKRKLEESMRRFEEENDRLRHESSSASAKLNAKNETIEQLKVELYQLEKKLGEKEKQFNLLMVKTTRNDELVATFERNFKQVMEEIKEIGGTLHREQESVESLKRTHKNVMELHDEVTEVLQLRSQDAVAMRQLHKKLHERVTLLEAEIATSHNQLHILESQIEQEKQQNKALKDDLEKERNDRELSLASLKEVQGLLERATKRATDQEELISELRAANEQLQSRYFELEQETTAQEIRLKNQQLEGKAEVERLRERVKHLEMASKRDKQDWAEKERALQDRFSLVQKLLQKQTELSEKTRQQSARQLEESEAKLVPTKQDPVETQPPVPSADPQTMIVSQVIEERPVTPLSRPPSASYKSVIVFPESSETKLSDGDKTSGASACSPPTPQIVLELPSDQIPRRIARESSHIADMLDVVRPSSPKQNPVNRRRQRQRQTKPIFDKNCSCGQPGYGLMYRCRVCGRQYHKDCVASEGHTFGALYTCRLCKEDLQQTV